MRILVSGAGGFIGRHLVPFLAAQGHEVLPLTRGRNGVPAELTEIGEWRDWPAGLDAVLHLGALNPGRRDKSVSDVPALHRVNVAGSQALAERAAAEGVKRLVFLSTANVHRSKGTTPVREEDELHPQSAYAASKLAAEAVLRQTEARTGMEICILRPAPVYGPGGRGVLGSLARLARSPLPLPLDIPAARRSVLGLGNCLDAVHAAARNPRAAGDTFLVADPEPLAIGAIVAALRRGLGRRPLLLPFPAKLIGGLAGVLRRREEYDRLFGSFVVDPAKIGERLGWRPLLPSEEGLARVLEQQRTAGEPLA